jgi:glucose/arabinose dehydrogenase
MSQSARVIGRTALFATLAAAFAGAAPCYSQSTVVQTQQIQTQTSVQTKVQTQTTSTASAAAGLPSPPATTLLSNRPARIISNPSGNAPNAGGGGGY